MTTEYVGWSIGTCTAHKGGGEVDELVQVCMGANSTLMTVNSARLMASFLLLAAESIEKEVQG